MKAEFQPCEFRFSLDDLEAAVREYYAAGHTEAPNLEGLSTRLPLEQADQAQVTCDRDIKAGPDQVP